ncbi:ROK family transcriptional regulator [Cellulomonas sp. PhB143]|uniref:ROK family transcriptional regulator n=1 Tax=Cellulomonas sp. PhB143 TaxID=2485186 RepID=UPI000F462EA7|nr:ROK family transcriptional regulator [Cellulomonas sp. PhB143]ROS79044.1 putative NBD/HSP70 family sugar kinase [Cellulomonas sp. PhB143]
MPRPPGDDAGARRDAGSQRSLRQRNLRLLLSSLAARGPTTQAGLARSTGLSTGSVSSLVRDLVDEGLVRTRSVVSGGRRSVEVSLAPDERVVLGVDVGRSHAAVLASDVSRRTFGLRRMALETGHPPEDTLARVAEAVDDLLEEHGIARERVPVCGMALPASLATDSGQVLQANVLPNWAGVDVVAMTREIFGMPTIIENDADLGALAHTGLPQFRDLHTLVYVKVASGIGAGLVVDGGVYRSSTGMAGEIGHVPVVDNGDLCYCGNRGCLETVASTRRLVTDFERVHGVSGAHLADVLAAAAAGDPPTVRILQDAGTALGRVLGVVTSMLGPDVVVLGGPLTSVAGPLLDAVLESARQRTMPAALQGATLELSELGEDAEVRGACLLALSHLRDVEIAVRG